MKQLPRISALLYLTPWAILPADHAELGLLYRNYLKGNLQIEQITQAPEALQSAEWVSSGISYEIDAMSGLMVINLSGIISKHAPDQWCGPSIVDVAKLDLLLGEVRDNAAIDTVIFNWNSPGGCVVGLLETAELIREISETKRTVAYTDYQMCSAAYYLAGACDEIYCAPSSIIGSIGTYCAALDDSRAWEMEGLELKLFKVGDLKAMGHPGKPWTPEEEAYMQGLADASGKEFRDYVQQRRPAVEDSTMQGQWFFANHAPAGLHDGFRNNLTALIEEVLAAREI